MLHQLWLFQFNYALDPEHNYTNVLSLDGVSASPDGPKGEDVSWTSWPVIEDIQFSGTLHALLSNEINVFVLFAICLVDVITFKVNLVFFLRYPLN